MEVVRRRGPQKGKQRRLDHDEHGLPADGEGALHIMITDENYVKIGNVRIYLHYIKNTGSNGGCRQVKLRIIAPLDIRIERRDREGNKLT